jgi:hypothetical protein
MMLVAVYALYHDALAVDAQDAVVNFHFLKTDAAGFAIYNRRAVGGG